ncbi:MAG: hypothetical protein U0838_06715 [Chloroflexota bacterium]
MGDKRRPILLAVIVLFTAGILLTAVAVGVGIWLGAGQLFPDRATLDAREAAVRATNLAAVQGRLDATPGWRVVAVRAESSYYTPGTAPVDQRWGLASGSDVVGKDAAAVLNALGARRVRVAVVGQCAGTSAATVAVAVSGSTPGEGGSPPPDIEYVPFATDRLTCDGHAHAVVSEPYIWPDVPASELDWTHLFLGAGDDNATNVDRFVVLVASTEAAAPDTAALEQLADQAFGGPLP